SLQVITPPETSNASVYPSRLIPAVCPKDCDDPPGRGNMSAPNMGKRGPTWRDWRSSAARRSTRAAWRGRRCLFSHQRLHFGGREITNLASPDHGVLDGADAGAAQTFHGMPDGITHVTHLPIAPLAEGEFHQRLGTIT